jgi:hypothetical protein
LLAALPVLSLASAWVFGVYLLLSSFYYSYVWLLAAGGQKAAPAE